MGKLIFEQETFAIRGAVYEVYREMGIGFVEPVYQECLELELARREIPFICQQPLELAYKGQPLSQTYIPDFVCYNQIIVEIKAVSDLTDIHRAQLMNYLAASSMRVGLLVNFGHHPKAEIDRIVK